MAIGLRFCLPLHIGAGKEDVKSGPAVCRDTEDLNLWICGQCPFVQISLVERNCRHSPLPVALVCVKSKRGMRLPSFRLERRNIAMLQISDLYSARNRAVRVFNGWYFCSVCGPPASSSCHALFGRLVEQGVDGQ